MTLWKCCTQYAANLENTTVATGLENVGFHFNPKKGQCQRMFKLLYNCAHFTWQQGKMLKILQGRLQQYGNSELSDVQFGFIKSRTINQIANIHWIIEKAGESQKNIYFSFIDWKLLTVCITTNWKILEMMRIPDHLTCFLRNLNLFEEATVRTRHGAMG